MRKLAKIVRELDSACDVVDSSALTDQEISYFMDQGFDWLDVEQAWNNQWYTAGKCPEKPENIILNELRDRRDCECFQIINRGQFWYDTLSDTQKEELRNWYQEWLDVTETKIIPEKPEWLI